MAGRTVCPRCGATNSFLKGYLPETCVCRVCQSQLDWREIPGCGPDCRPLGSAQSGMREEGAEDRGGPGGGESGAGGPGGGSGGGTGTERKDQTDA